MGQTTPLSRREIASAAFVTLAATALYLAPFARGLHRPGREDWQQWTFFEAATRKAVVEHGELPLWNPYACGGMPLHAHPFTRALAPLAPLHWLIDHPASLRLEAFLLVAGIALGAYLLGRRAGLSRAASALAGVVAAFAGTTAGRLHSGHLGLLQVPPLLLAVYARRRAGPDGPAIALGAAGIAVAIFSGGNFLAAAAAIALGFEALWDAAAKQSVRPLLRAAGIVALGFALAAIKIIPVVDFMRDYPRATTGHDPFARGGPLAALLRLPGAVVEAPFLWHEYAAYVGALPILLALAGLALAPRRAARPLALVALLAVIAAGDFAPLAPWAWLHRLPIFGAMRIPARFLVLAVVPLGEAAGVGLDALAARLPRAPARLAWLAAAAIFLDLGLAARPALGRAFVEPSPLFFLDGVPLDGAFRQVRGSPNLMAQAAERNLGTLRCADGVPIRRSERLRGATQRGYRGEVWLMGEGSVHVARWSPSSLSVDVDVQAPRGATLVVNQNFDHRWRADTPHAPRDFEGLLAVPLPPGARRVTLSYRPASVAWGAAASALALVFALALARRRGHTTQARSGRSAS